jgi:hypothetical protein
MKVGIPKQSAKYLSPIVSKIMADSIPMSVWITGRGSIFKPKALSLAVNFPCGLLGCEFTRRETRIEILDGASVALRRRDWRQ